MFKVYEIIVEAGEDDFLNAVMDNVFDLVDEEEIDISEHEVMKRLIVGFNRGERSFTRLTALSLGAERAVHLGYAH